MRRLLASLTLALCLSIGTIIRAAPAGADELSYLTAIFQLGITPNDGNYVTPLRWGYAVCADKSMWVPLDTTVNNLLSGSAEQHLLIPSQGHGARRQHLTSASRRHHKLCCSPTDPT
jgi:hypothetical protein